jgi:hypothetical protein
MMQHLNKKKRNDFKHASHLARIFKSRFFIIVYGLWVATTRRAYPLDVRFINLSNGK